MKNTGIVSQLFGLRPLRKFSEVSQALECTARPQMSPKQNMIAANADDLPEPNTRANAAKNANETVHTIPIKIK